MNGNGKIELPGNIEHVFNKLLDPEVLQNCIMGCKHLEQIDESTYKAELSVGIAAVKGKYDATIILKDVEQPNHYKLVVKGEGSPGFVNAEGAINLTAMDDQNTLLKYSYTANVGGKVASIGQRMLGGVAKLIISDFFKRAKKELSKIHHSA
ncbi:carbon monoxide dehydrogenase subunit G [Caldalkalibacillus uzonensis]|uniref:Carbon monoxide dehydrogenase subunit G n=1 Tax=Caldalkalibacillus uzonensis TaxID=353224 RepID=A0ABU0CXY1_9BACI|nr:carbon monoxide dehydrogenase subunit G [Caldalkalibacillus uzonensis]MDQ0341009.1 carbon monoxide dehydrogenase subunit G [Caldalkalibacillus uzonensis]